MEENDPDYSLTEEEFARWLPPRVALASVRDALKPDIAKPLILKRISDEELFTAARKIVLTQGARGLTHRYMRISKARWRGDEIQVLWHDFWETGDVVFSFMDGSLRNPPIVLSCVDVRFDPEGIANLIPKPPTPGPIIIDVPRLPQIVIRGLPDAAPVPNMGPIPNSAVKAWFDGLPPEQKGLGYRKLWPASKIALGQGVRRKQVEALCEGRKPGPKPIAPK